LECGDLSPLFRGPFAAMEDRKRRQVAALQIKAALNKIGRESNRI
jgi:hypothetical protein